MADIEEPTEMLATRRSRRSTAGNRMEAALAEMATDDAMKDMDDDKEFFVVNDEQDEFGSDFESTDEEAEKVAVVGAETEVAEEERRVRKAARSKLERMTAAAHMKHKDTFNPDVQLKDKEGPSKPRMKPKTRGSVKLGDVVDAETGEIVVAAKSARATLGKKRVSKRKHTVMNTSATTTRQKQNEQKKASVSKKHKTEHKVWSQAELLAQALDTEEGNITEHRDYLKNEAEKRKRARVMRTKVEGPLIRWKSRLEEISVVLPPPPPPPLPPAPAPVAVVAPPPKAPVPSFAPTITSMPNLAAYRGVYGGYGGTFTPTTYTFTTGANGLTASTASTASNATFISQSGTKQPFTQFQHYQPPNASTSPFPMWPPPASTSQNHQPYYSLTATSTSTMPAATTATETAVATTTPIPDVTPVSETATPIGSPPTPAAIEAPIVSVPTPSVSIPPEVAAPSGSMEDKPKQPETRKETVTKNYVIHELAQQKSGPKPSWTSTMGAMFGDHVKWDEIKVYSGKNRPLSRPRQTCLITGQQAHYFDPRTGVPYANSRAYKTLTQLIKHEYVWDPSLGCYTNHRPIEQQPPASSSTS